MQQFEVCYAPEKKKHTNSTEITTAAHHTESQGGTQALGQHFALANTNFNARSTKA